MNGGDVIAEILRREGTEFLAVYPPQDLIDPAAKVGIRPIICRQERVGMAIADGFSRTTNGKRLGVFAMQRGPGSENAFPGAAQGILRQRAHPAHTGAAPTTTRAYISPDFSAVENYRHVTKWAAQTNYVERIPGADAAGLLPPGAPARAARSSSRCRRTSGRPNSTARSTTSPCAATGTGPTQTRRRPSPRCCWPPRTRSSTPARAACTPRRGTSCRSLPSYSRRQ